MAITIEELDLIQFGRVLHQRPGHPPWLVSGGISSEQPIGNGGRDLSESFDYDAAAGVYRLKK